MIEVIAATVVIALAPPGDVADCSRVEYRQRHLAECNMTVDNSHGGKGGGKSGLLGLGIGGIL